MFDTDSFQAFNADSHANIKCFLKHNPRNDALSTVTVEYYFGLSEKYELTISNDGLSHDMAFVMGNVKGFYDYIRFIHEKSEFRFCQFNKDQMTVTYQLKLFNQQKSINQEFKFIAANDQVIWKSQLKRKLDNFQFAFSNRMSTQIERNVKSYMSEDKERSLLKIDALDQKVSRQLDLMKDKLETIVNFVNNQSNSKEILDLKITRHRGRYNQEKKADNVPQHIEGDQRRSTRNMEALKKTKQIQKQPQKVAIVTLQNQKQNPSKVIEQWEKQYKKVYPIFQRDQTRPNRNQPLRHFIQKRSRGRPSRQQTNLLNQKPLQQPFVIEKIERGIGSNRTAEISKRLEVRDDSRYRKIQNPSLHKGQQVAKSLQQALKSFKPSNISVQKNQTKNESMIDERQEKKNIHRAHTNQNNDNVQKNGNQQQKSRKLSNPQVKSMHQKRLINEQNQTTEFRRQLFQKTTKPQEVIDLQNQEEYKKFTIKMGSRGVQQNLEKANLMNEEVLKAEEQDVSVKTIAKILREQIDSQKKEKVSPSDIRVYSQELDLESSSECQYNQINKMLRYYKKNKIEEKQSNNNRNLVQNQIKHQNKQENSNNEKALSEMVQQSSNIKIMATPNSKQSVSSLLELVDLSKQLDIETLPKAKVPSYKYLSSTTHITPNFSQRKQFIKNAVLADFFEFNNKQNVIVTKLSKSVRAKTSYVPLISATSLPITGKYFWSIRILKSQNYHICMGIVDMPSEIKVNQIPKNCDAVYILDGGLHDEKGGDKTQNKWRVKEGQPVDVLQMELLVEKGQMYVIMVVDMDKEEMQFYYNDQFISQTTFSSWCKKNKKRLYPYLALKSEKDCIQIV